MNEFLEQRRLGIADLRTDGVLRVRKAKYVVSRSKAQRTTISSVEQIQDSGFADGFRVNAQVCWVFIQLSF